MYSAVKTKRRLVVLAIGAASLMLSACVDSGPEAENAVTTTTVAGASPTVDEGTTITTIPDGVEVPDVTELDTEEAVKALTMAGGFVGVVSPEVVLVSVDEDFAKLGLVASQSPVFSEFAKADSEIELKVYGVDSPSVEEATAILAAQSHEVFTDFLDRYNRLGINAGRLPLESAPVAGPAREALELMEVLNTWMVACHESGVCTDQYDPALVFGEVEVLLQAGVAAVDVEGVEVAPVISPLGDGTYFVGGVYHAPTGIGSGFAYVNGGRFVIEEGRAILIDVSSSADLVWAPNVWMSRRVGSGSGQISVVDAVDGVHVEVKATAPRWHLGDKWSSWVLVEVTNETDAVIVAGGGSLEVRGENASEINAIFEEPDAVAMEINQIWGRRVNPGETREMLVSFLFTDSVSGGGSFVIPMPDPTSGEELFGLKIAMDKVTSCRTTAAPTGPGECLAPAAIAKQFGFTEHIPAHLSEP